MYRVFCDGALIYHSKLSSMAIYNPSLELEVNKTGSFEFTIYPDHPRYDLIRKLKSIVTVYQDDELLFRGRVLEEESGWHNEKKVTCEGDMAFLLDSILRPFSFSGTPWAFLSHVLNLHNEQVEKEKRFSIGRVTVDGYITYESTEYATAKDTLDKALLETYGGYFIPRFDGETAFLDYLADINVLAPQTIEFGKNLLDLKIMRKGADIATAVIPLGAKIKDEEGNDTDKRLTIKSVNDGKDYIQNDDAVARYGFIVKTAIFDDITEPETLKIQGRGELSKVVKLPDTIELTAADMAAMGQDITSFHIATMVQVTSPPHGIDQRLEVSKLSIKLLDPAANKMTLGGVLSSFTQKVSKPIPVTVKDGKDGEDGVTLRIDSSRGTVFKNNTVSTTLNVVIFRGGKTITDAAAMRQEFGSAAHLEWQWQRIGETTFGTILSTDERLTNEGFSLLLTPGDVDTKVVFKCQLVTA